MSFCSPEVLFRADSLMKTTDKHTGPRYWQSDEKRKTDAMLAKALIPIARIASILSVWAVHQFDHIDDPLYVHTVYHPLQGEFPIHKIKTLCEDAHAREIAMIGKESIRALKCTRNIHPLATAAGRILRPLSIDEAPQLLYDISVTKKDAKPMWTVGPRPRTRDEFDRDIASQVTVEPFTSFVRHLRSGLRWGGIGLPIYLGRGKLSPAQQTELDCIYAERASRTSDIRLTLQLWKVPIFYRGQ